MKRLSLAAGMLRRLCVFGVIPLASVPAQARPLDEAGALAVYQFLDLRSRGPELPNPGLFAVAQTGTTWFGGTVWAADSMRWEAIEGQLWTFDSGVGSSIVPGGGAAELSAPTRDWVDPAKLPGLHASMEGWIGVDHTSRSHSFFRRLAASDPRWDAVCVGTAGGLSGEYSFWAGVFPGEADSLCYIQGQGYGNEWRICLEHSFQYGGGNMTLGFRYRVDLEPRFDYVFVYMDTTGNDDDAEFMSLTGSREGQIYRGLFPGEQLPVTFPRTITLKFCLETDGAWSDADGMHPTSHGAFAIDDILVAGKGVYSLATFETGNDGWVLTPPESGPGGEWANLVALSELPTPLTPCTCALQDTVLVFHDDSNRHPRLQNNVAVSPWIDLREAGLVGSPGKVMRMSLYAELPLKNYVFARTGAQWYPAWCLATEKVTRSPWTDATFVYYFGGAPQCTNPETPGGTQVDLSPVIPPEAEQVRLALGVISYCRFFADCTGMSNTTPWFDEVGLGVYGTPGPPPIFASDIDRPQDNFPENGTINLNAPGRVDCNNIQGAARPEIGTTLGDTLIVRGGVGSAEVYVHFRVVPGPGTNGNAFNTWRNKHADSPIQAGFKRARCDTAERGLSGPNLGAWMTTYHEADPNFTGTDRDIDPIDVAPNGGLWRLKNDIFPDDLFSMGTRVDVFYTAHQTGQPAHWREPPGTGTYEMEILPSSATAGGDWSCVLYVDHYNRDAQGPIEAALMSILGTGSENYESTNWDRFDVNAEASGQASFGRPLQTEYGASVIQILGACKALVWNTGGLGALALTKEDGDILIPWLTMLDFDFNNLYLSGDGVIYSAINEAASEPSARRVVEDLLGVTLRTQCATGAFRDADCPVPGSPLDLTECVRLEPVTGAVVAGSGAGRTLDHGAPGNGCSEYRSFDVLETRVPDFGLSVGDERYATALKSAEYASISVDAGGAVLNYKGVVDGSSVHRRGEIGQACGSGASVAVTERLREALSWFGYGSAQICDEPSSGTGVEQFRVPGPSHRTSLRGVTPNPLKPSSLGRVGFTLARQASVLLDIYDLQGRRVKTVFDGVGVEGENEAVWDGTDASGTPVSSGVYFLRMRSDGVERSTRVVVVEGAR